MTWLASAEFLFVRLAIEPFLIVKKSLSGLDLKSKIEPFLIEMAEVRERGTIMSVYKRGGRWQYDFWIKGVRYKGSIPEARIKPQAEQAEIRIKSEVFEGKYGKAVARVPRLADFIEKTYLPWSRTNKRS
jgi:hypothetical protein